jgi:hypothetical protein
MGDLDGDGVLDAAARRGNDGFDVLFFKGVKAKAQAAPAPAGTK